MSARAGARTGFKITGNIGIFEFITRVTGIDVAARG